MDPPEDSCYECVVRVRGLPWSCTEEQLRMFFKDEDGMDKIEMVHFTYNREGRPSGEAYLKFSDVPACENALKKDKEYLNKRYVEVFPSKQAEMDYVMRHAVRSAAVGNDVDAVVRMRGLPFGCTKEEVASFFLGLEIAPSGIVILTDPFNGRPSGEAFVQFVNRSDAEKALQKHMEKLGHRYIEVFRSSAEEIRRFLKRQGGPGGSGGGPRRHSGYSDWNGGSPMAASYAMDSGYGLDIGAYGMDGAGYRMEPGGLSMGYGNDVYAIRMRPTPYDRPTPYPSRMRPSSYASFSGGLSSSRAFSAGGRMMGGVGGILKGAMHSFNGGAQGRGGRMGSGHFVHMRGIPFNANEADIIEFFSPLRIANIEVVLEQSGRASGQANVEFYTHNDAVEAMKRDREMLGHRYVELFLNSSAAGRPAYAHHGFGDDYI